MKYFCWEKRGLEWTPTYYLTHPRDLEMITKIKRSSVIQIPENLDEMIRLYPKPRDETR